MRLSRRFIRGAAGPETLLAAPVVLLFGLLAVQWSIVFQARSGLSHALGEGARAGAVEHAEPHAIEAGLVRGLMPFVYGADAGNFAGQLTRTAAHVDHGRTAGWFTWRQISPTAASFDDWAVPARDDRGRPIEGQEIPNDNLAYRRASPRSGVAAMRAGLPLGAASGQTLADANLLKLEMTYGVKLTVPLAGAVTAWVMRIVGGCNPATAKTLGRLDFGTPARDPSTPASVCPFLAARDEDGVQRPRWPVTVHATVRMQSPVRASAATPGTPAPRILESSSSSTGRVDSSDAYRPGEGSSGVGVSNPRVGSGQDGSANRNEGFLHFGGERGSASQTPVRQVGDCA